MRQSHTIPETDHSGAPADGGVARRRGRRVVLLLIMICMLNAFDLAFTLLARLNEYFMELNPIASQLIDNTSGLIAFKISFVALGCLLMFRFRTHRLAEIGCWGVCAFYSILAGIWWIHYFQLM